MTDTSTPAQRVGFNNTVEAGTPNLALITTVANSPIPMSDAACLLLDMPINSTMAAGAAKLLARPAPGLSVY